MSFQLPPFSSSSQVIPPSSEPVNDPPEMDIASSKPPLPEDSSNKTEKSEEEKKTTNQSSDDKMTTKAKKRDWMTLVVTTSAVALAVIGLIAACFLIAAPITGQVTMLTIGLPFAIAAICFAGSGILLGCRKKITDLLDTLFTKIISVFRKNKKDNEAETKPANSDVKV